MQCPVCQTQLTMSERQGIEIDYCPQCRGVWLDRGELDKIIERSTTGNTAAPNRGMAAPQYPERNKERDWDEDRPHSGYHPAGKRRKNWLEELFD